MYDYLPFTTLFLLFKDLFVQETCNFFKQTYNKNKVLAHNPVHCLTIRMCILIVLIHLNIKRPIPLNDFRLIVCHLSKAEQLSI